MPRGEVAFNSPLERPSMRTEIFEVALLVQALTPDSQRLPKYAVVDEVTLAELDRYVRAAKLIPQTAGCEWSRTWLPLETMLAPFNSTYGQWDEAWQGRAGGGGCSRYDTGGREDLTRGIPACGLRFLLAKVAMPATATPNDPAEDKRWERRYRDRSLVFAGEDLAAPSTFDVEWSDPTVPGLFEQRLKVSGQLIHVGVASRGLKRTVADAYHQTLCRYAAMTHLSSTGEVRVAASLHTNEDAGARGPAWFLENPVDIEQVKKLRVAFYTRAGRLRAVAELCAPWVRFIETADRLVSELPEMGVELTEYLRTPYPGRAGDAVWVPKLPRDARTRPHLLH